MEPLDQTFEQIVVEGIMLNGECIDKLVDRIAKLEEKIRLLEEQGHSTINAPSPMIKRYVSQGKAQIAILECLSDGKKKTVDDFVGVSGTSRTYIYRALRGKGTLKNPKGGLLVREPRLKRSIYYGGLTKTLRIYSGWRMKYPPD